MTEQVDVWSVRQLMMQRLFMRTKAALEINRHLYDVDQPESGGWRNG